MKWYREDLEKVRSRDVVTSEQKDTPKLAEKARASG
jgi:hypothetical protein